MGEGFEVGGGFSEVGFFEERGFKAGRVGKGSDNFVMEGNEF